MTPRKPRAKFGWQGATTWDVGARVRYVGNTKIQGWQPNPPWYIGMEGTITTKVGDRRPLWWVMWDEPQVRIGPKDMLHKYNPDQSIAIAQDFLELI